MIALGVVLLRMIANAGKWIQKIPPSMESLVFEYDCAFS
jgi:hypothetical protein